MAIVVSDTSPIRALAHLGLVDVLHSLYGQIFLPPSVQHELSNPSPGMPPFNVSQFPFLVVQTPRDQARIQQFLQSLDPGESEALALALEVGATIVIIDEAKGRRMAKRLGLRPIGALGILVESKRRGLVPLIRPLIETLENDLRFFVSAKLRAQILQSAGE